MTKPRIDLLAAEARLHLFCDTVGLEIPTWPMTIDRAPTDELLDFCVANGISLDWLFLDDVTAMIWHSHRAALGTRKH